MHVCVIIVGFQNADDITTCLDALSRQTHADFEVLICENGGEAAARALATQLPSALPKGQPVAMIEAPDNPGYAGGINRVLTARPDADAWWILNPDTVPEPAALAAMCEVLGHGEADAVGNVLIDSEDRVQNTGARFIAWLARTEALGANAPAPIVEDPRMNVIMGASMLVGRRWLEVAGPMVEDYFLYCEEVEWALRAQKRGLRIALAPTARVKHHQGTTTGSAGEIASRGRLPIYLDERNKLNTVRDIAPARLAIAIPAAFILALIRYGRRGAWRQLGYAISGWWAGVANKRGKPPWFGH